MNAKWLPYELHTHTFHSDGRHTLGELAASAKELGLHGIAMTDHNTMSPLLNRDAVQDAAGLHIVRGMEWTTFYGHLLMLGIEHYVDWRDLGIRDIHKGIERVHRQGGIVGIAHPFRIGNPICTGCYWEYEVSNWHDIDYIEVWSYTMPSILTSNQRAFQMWTNLLNEGCRIAAVCGRDWHDSVPTSDPVAVTYLQLAHSTAPYGEDRHVVEAIRAGAVSVTMGPLLLLELTSDQSVSYGIGDVAAVRDLHTEWEVTVRLDMSARAGYWQLHDQLFTVELNSNQGTVAKLTLPYSGEAVTCKLSVDGMTWLRAELYGVIAGCRTMIAFTNPVYLEQA